jgi:predicted permease
MQDWLRDVRYGSRLLLRSPGFSAVAVLSLALGIGVTTAMLSVGRSVLLQPLPVDRPAQLVVLNWLRADDGRNPMQLGSGDGRDQRTGRNLNTNFSFPAYRALRDTAGQHADVFAFTFLRQVNVSVKGQAMTAGGMLVSGSFFGGIRAPLHIGRGLDDGDEKPGAEPAVVLGYTFWQRVLGGDRGVLGLSVRINGSPFTIVGVTAPGYFGVSNGGFFPPTDVTMTLGAYPAVQSRWTQQFGSMFHAPGVLWLRVMARMPAAADSERITQALNVALAQQFASSGVPSLEQARAPEIRLLPGSRGLDSLRSTMATPIYILTAVAALVLLIACVNVAGLMVARGVHRRHEFWVRRALGAGRARLVRQTLMENLLLAASGGVLGLAVAVWTARALVPMLAGSGVTAIDVELDAPLLLIAFATLLAAGLIFGLLPAIRSIGSDTPESLRQTGSGGTMRQQTAGRVLVLVQIAVSVPLLVGAMLFLRTLHNLADVDLGFEPHGLVLFRLDPSLNGYDRARTDQLYWRVLDRVHQMPGVRSATLVENSLISGWVSNTSVVVEGGRRASVLVNRVGPAFFETFGMQLVVGRALGIQDRVGAPRVGVVNEAAVRELLEGRNPVGRQIAFTTPAWFGESAEIVGVVRDSKYSNLRRDVRPTVFLASSQNPVAAPMFVVTRASVLSGLPERLRAAVAEIDPDVAVADMKTQEQQIEETIGRERAFTLLLVSFGGFALVLAAIGLHGVTSYNIARRTGEIGIRMALGAQRLDVLWLIMRQVIWLGAGGLALGVPLALVASRTVRALLFGVAPVDVMSFSVGGVILFVVTLAAGLIPAARAARLNPLVALRGD